MRERTIFILTIVALVLVGLGFAAGSGLNLMPEAAAERADIVDQLFRVMIGIAAVIFLLVEGALIYAVFRFRAKEGDVSDAVPSHGNLGLEIVWTLIPAVIVVVIGVYAFQVLAAIEAPSSNEMIVEVTGRQFAWEFRYPEQDLTSGELHLVVNRPTRFEITSADVIHSFWIPAFRAKRDATPGQISELVVTPNREGVYAARCAELCGAGHADMVTQVVVESEEEFNAWVEDLGSLPDDPTEAGRFVYEKYGCGACHALEDAGTTGTIGPELDGLGERAGTVVEGMDAETYVRESILDPSAHVAEGFQDGLMPQDFGQRIRGEELDALVNYLLEQ